jgi:hypothetical protein
MDEGYGFGYLILLGIILTIVYYTFLLTLAVIALSTVVASVWGVGIGIKNFYLVFKQAHQAANSSPSKPHRLKFIWPRYTVQPARLMYFYDGGWFVIQYISKNVWRTTKDDASKCRNWGQNFLDNGSSHLEGNFFQKIWAFIRYYGPGWGLMLGGLFHFVAALSIVGIFMGLQSIFLCLGVLFASVVTFILGIGTYLYGSFYKVYYRCPNCHEQIQIPEYICPQCSEPHTRLWPSVYGVTHHTCLGAHNGNLCGRSLPTLTFLGRDKLITRCPSCDYQLEGLGGTNAHLPIVGDPYSGKSTYTIMAVQQFIDRYAPENRLKVKLPDPLHQQKYNTSISTLKAGRFLLKTASADDGAKAINLELKTPNQAVANLLYLYDTAGEDTATDDKASGQKYFKYVNGVFFIIDPFSIPQVWKEYEQQLPSQLQTSEPNDRNLDALFARMLELFETKTQLSGGKKFSQPVAVILTKTDACDLEAKVGSVAARRYIQDNPGKVQTEDEAINILVEEFLRDRGANNLVVSLHQYFANVRFFSCSALGTDVASEQPFEGVRVLEPMLWLFGRANVLPNRSPIFERVVRSKPWIKYVLPLIVTGVIGGIGYAGYTLVRWSLDTLNLKEQKNDRLPVTSIRRDPRFEKQRTLPIK